MTEDRPRTAASSPATATTTRSRRRLLKGVGPCAYRGEIRTFVDRPQWTYLFADMTPAYEATQGVAGHAGLLVAQAGDVPGLRLDHLDPPRVHQALAAERGHAAGNRRPPSASWPAAPRRESSNPSDTHRLTVTRGASKLFVQPLLPEQPLVRRVGGEGYSSWSDGKNWNPPPDQGRLQSGTARAGQALLADRDRAGLGGDRRRVPDAPRHGRRRDRLAPFHRDREARRRGRGGRDPSAGAPRPCCSIPTAGSASTAKWSAPPTCR